MKPDKRLRKRAYDQRMEEFVRCQRKVAYPTLAIAKQRGRELAYQNGKRLKSRTVSYKCRNCGKYHNGRD